MLNSPVNVHACFQTIHTDGSNNTGVTFNLDLTEIPVVPNRIPITCEFNFGHLFEIMTDFKHENKISEQMVFQLL